MDKLLIDELTEATLTGSGAFDVLMRANKAHLLEEYTKNRIKGPEYATVYLGSLEQTMRIALEFLIQGRKAGLEERLLEKQIELVEKEIEQAEKRLEMMECEQELCQAQIRKTDAETALIIQNTTNASLQEDTIRKEQCKLDAEYDVLKSTDLKIAQETTLLAQKTATEKAQTVGQGVDEDSIIGRQKQLYKAQTEGFTRDAEQAAAKILADSWSVRRTTDEGTQANTTNKLDDATIGRAINKLLQGVNA